MAQLPAYKPSGAGGYVDLKNINVSQIISWGAFKHQFKSKYKAAAGTEWINGVEYFKPLDIRYSLRNNQSKEYKFMEFIGFSDEDLQRLREDLDNPDSKVETASMGYILNEDYEQSDFDMYWDLYMTERFKFDKISVQVEDVSYEVGQLNETPLSSRSFGINYNSEIWISYGTTGVNLDDPHPGLIETKSFSNPAAGYRVIAEKPDNRILNEHLTTRAYKNGVDVTSRINPAILTWFGMMSILEPTMMPITSSHVTKTYENRFVTSGNEGTIVKWVNIVMKEYINIKNISYFDMKKKLALYTNKYRDESDCDNGQTEEKCDESITTKTYTRIFWIAMQEEISKNIHNMTSGLFEIANYREKVCYEELETYSCFNNYEHEYVTINMRYDGIDECQPDTFGYFMSQFLHISTTIDKGGWFERFIGGLIKAILSFISAVLDLFLKIPILKQLTEILLSVIGTIFGVNVSTAKEILKQIILAVVIIIVGSFIQPMLSSMMPSMTTLTGTSAAIATNVSAGLLPSMSTMITYSSQAMSIFNAAMNGAKIGSAKEYALAQADRDYRMFKAQESAYKAKEASWGTMGSYEEHQQKDNMMYNIMFNPFDNHPQAVPADELPSGINMF